MTTRPAHSADRLFLIYIGALTVLGLAILLSASTPSGYLRYNDPYYLIKRQVLFGLLPGLAAFVVAARINYQWWRKLVWLAYGAALVLLLAVFVPHLGVTINGHRSWLASGSFSFQPAEVAKLALIFLLAHLLSERKIPWDDWRQSLLPILSLIAPIILLIAVQPDIGTLSIIVVIAAIMMFVGQMPVRYLLIMALLGALAFGALVLAAPYRLQRFTTFLHPEMDPRGVGYQVNQAFLAVGSGGWWGLGWGHSRQKFQYLPEVSADTIYGVYAEETGFVFSTLLVLLLLAIALRGLKIAAASPDEFGRLLVTGIVVWFVWQSFLNIGATIGAMPLTGVPLPFVSHGGTALMMALAAAGIVANVSRFSNV